MCYVPSSLTFCPIPNKSRAPFLSSVLNTLGKLREDGEWKWHASIYLLDAKCDDGLEEVNGSCRFPFQLKRGAIPVKIRHFRKIGVTPV